MKILLLSLFLLLQTALGNKRGVRGSRNRYDVVQAKKTNGKLYQGDEDVLEEVDSFYRALAAASSISTSAPSEIDMLINTPSASPTEAPSAVPSTAPSSSPSEGALTTSPPTSPPTSVSDTPQPTSLPTAVPVSSPPSSPVSTCNFEVASTPLSWTDHQAAAEAQDCNLASILNEEEDNEVLQMIRDDPDVADVEFIWVGGKLRSNGTLAESGAANWEWSDGSLWSYENWLSGEPNNYEGQNETLLNVRSAAGWNDGSEISILPAVYKCCE